MNNSIDLRLARSYMALMADGKNPVTKEYVSANDTVFDERLQEVCDFIMVQLDKLISQAEKDVEVLTLKPSYYPITMRDLVHMLNRSVISNNKTVKFTSRKIEKWLDLIGAIRLIKLNGTTLKKMTGYSQEFGVSYAPESTPKRQKLQFNTDAQSYIFDHCLEILDV